VLARKPPRRPSLYCIGLNRVFAASTSFVLALGCRRVDPATAPALTGSYPGAKPKFPPSRLADVFDQVVEPVITEIT
jgi:hypothetical protein